MTVVELLAEMQKLGVLLACDEGALRVKAPAGVLTPDLKTALAQHKAALLALLESARAGPAPATLAPPAPEPPVAPAAPAASSPSVKSQAAALPAPQLNKPVRIPLACLSEYLDAHHLKVVGGDPGLGRRPWRPRLYLAERVDARQEEN
jgi:hypothetical protein